MIEFPCLLGFLTKPVIGLLGGIWGIVGIVAAFLAKAYLVPFLKIEKNRRYAEWIARIADDLTDDLKHRYPEEEWAQRLDELVDKIMEVCSISEETARRALAAATAWKA
jgi:hypothetical protein